MQAAIVWAYFVLHGVTAQVPMFAQALARGEDPFGLTKAQFCQLLVNSICSPNYILNAVQAFLALS